MTANDFISAGIPIEDNAISLLYAETALDWMISNTTLQINKADLSGLPAGAKLFVVRSGEIMRQSSTVTSESLGGMSQSFSTETKNNLLYDLAFELIGGYMKSQVSFTAAQSRWD